MSNRNRHNGRMAIALSVFVAGMVGVSFAAVPLYQLFCQVTGYGGTPKTDVAQASAAVSERVITVRFAANTNGKLPWRFKPVERKMTVRLGEPNLAFYRASNLSTEKVTGTALFNVAPYKAGPFFSKIDCFCFTEQTLGAGETVDMPIQFFVDPEIFTDPDTKDLKEITLSYTFYPSESEGKKTNPAKSAAAIDDAAVNEPGKS